VEDLRLDGIEVGELVQGLVGRVGQRALRQRVQVEQFSVRWMQLRL
jgi:hypothetical protein